MNDPKISPLACYSEILKIKMANESSPWLLGFVFLDSSMVPQFAINLEYSYLFQYTTNLLLMTLIRRGKQMEISQLLNRVENIMAS